MHLNEMAREAWEGAERQGLHKNLDRAPSLGPREQALLALVPLALKLNEVIQYIKRHGVSVAIWDDALYDLEHALENQVTSAFDRLLDLCGDHAPHLPVDPGDWLPRTAIRMLLVGTEVAEALEVLDPTKETPLEARMDALADEGSDIVIRLGDIFYPLGIDLDDATARTLARNTQRVYGYGTPLAQEAPHGTP